jgi:hypothetical protein
VSAFSPVARHKTTPKPHSFQEAEEQISILKHSKEMLKSADDFIGYQEEMHEPVTVMGVSATDSVYNSEWGGGERRGARSVLTPHNSCRYHRHPSHLRRPGRRGLLQRRPGLRQRLVDLRRQRRGGGGGGDGGGGGGGRGSVRV